MKVRVDRISVGGHNLLLSIPYKCKSIGLTNSFRHFEHIVSPSSNCNRHSPWASTSLSVGLSFAQQVCQVSLHLLHIKKSASAHQATSFVSNIGTLKVLVSLPYMIMVLRLCSGVWHLQ